MIVLKKIVCLLLSLIDMIVVSSGGNSFFMNKADVSVTINPYIEYQTVDGFGSSACWWAQLTDGSPYADDAAKALYSKDGLGLNIYRYNIGGGEKDNPDSRISGSRATESFYYYNEETGKYEFDFTRDAAAQKMLQKCLSYGCIDTVVLFANSPHYSMTVSGQATGGFKTEESNLPPENYQLYADYFLTITEYFLEQGVPVKYISPINEPQWGWGGDWVGQEGCHYEPEEVVNLFRVFAKEIKKRNLPVKLMGPESGEVVNTPEKYFDLLLADGDIKDVLGSLAYHSYWSDTRSDLKSEFGSKIKKYSGVTVDMTEWCELPCTHDINDFGGALLIARVISQDLGMSNANSWSAWVGVNNYGINENGKKISDGLLVSNEEFTELYTAARYYALAHFSKYIPVGSVRIDARKDIFDYSVVEKDNKSNPFLNVTAYKTPEGKIVCVIVNEGKDRNVYLESAKIGNMQVITSVEGEYLKETYSGRAKTGVKIPANSITTVIYN